MQRHAIGSNIHVLNSWQAWLGRISSVLFPASESFTSGTDSLDVDDTNFNRRWKLFSSEGTPTTAISGRKLVLSIDGDGAAESALWENNANPFYGDFTYQANISNIAISDTTLTGSVAGIEVLAGSTRYIVGWWGQNSGDEYKAYYNGSAWTLSAASIPASDTLKIYRVGSTVSLYIDGGVITTFSNAGAIKFRLYVSCPDTATLTASYANISAVDANSKNLLLADIPASDNFNGSGNSSGSVVQTDKGWVSRWTLGGWDGASGSAEITGSNLEVTADAGDNGYYAHLTGFELPDGFTLEVPWSAVFASETPPFYYGVQIGMNSGTFGDQIYMTRSRSDSGGGEVNAYVCNANDGGGEDSTATTDTGSTFKISRANGSSTVNFYKDSTLLHSGTNATNFKGISLRARTDDTTASAFTSIFGNISLVDGYGDPVYTTRAVTASDDFSGDYPEGGENSGAIKDQAYTDRGWVAAQSGGTVAIDSADEQLDLDASGSGSYANLTFNSALSITGDFYCKIAYSSLVLPTNTRWDMAIVGQGWHVGRAYDSSSGPGQSWHTFDGASATLYGADSANEGTIEVYRISGTIYMKTNGVLRTSFANATTVQNLGVQLWSTGAAGDASVKIDSFELLDGEGGNPIYVPYS